MGASAWAERLGNIDLPVLAGVLKRLNELTADSDTCAEALAEEIMKDAALTAQVLRIANSVHYRPGAESTIKTISRAVVQVGFPGIRAICISVMMIDSLLGDKPRDELLRCLARGFHSAVQARNIIGLMDQSAREECFTTALLLHLGDLAFWSRGGKQADSYSDLIKRGVLSVDEASQRVIGTNLKAISLELSRRWSLGPTLITALSAPNSRDPKVRSALLGDEISRSAEFGWDSKEFGETLARVSEFTGRSIAEVKKQLMASADEAGRVASTYGAGHVSHLIPSTEAPEPVVECEPDIRGELKPDAQFQLDVLKELAAMVASNTDVNSIFQMVLEGMHRGVGFERVAILLLNQNNDLLVKYAVGEGTEHWRRDVMIPARDAKANVLAYSLRYRETLLIKSRRDPQFRDLISAACEQLLPENGEFVLSPIYTSRREVGIFYADRGGFGGKIDQTQYESFKYFGQQANAALTKLAESRKQQAR